MAPKKILVVDDHIDTRIICRELLTHYGYEVCEAAGSQEAIDCAFTELPDLILLDFLMPDSDGLETLRQLRAHSALDHTAIVLYTAAATEAAALRAVDGIQGVLFKPADAKQLLDTVRGLIGEAVSAS